MKYTDWFNWSYVRAAVRAMLVLGIAPALGCGALVYGSSGDFLVATGCALLVYVLLPLAVVVGGAIGFALP